MFLKKTIYVLLLFYLVKQLLSVELKCQKDFFKTKLRSENWNNSVLLIWFPASVGTETTLNICSIESGLPLRRHCGYDRLTNSGKWEPMNENIQLINCSSIPQLCMEEPFEHNYIEKNGKTKHVINKWKTARLMEIGDLEKPCLKRTGLPLTRNCVYNPIMRTAQWEPLNPHIRNFSCLRETREALITYDLHNLYQKIQTDVLEDEVESKKVVKQMTELLIKPETVRVPADIKISSEILKLVTKENRDPELVTEVLNATNIIMGFDTPTIIKAEEVNGSTIFLQTIDKYFQNMGDVLVPTRKCQNTADGIFYKILNHTSIFYVNPACSNISGVAIYNTNVNQRYHHYDPHTGHYYRFLYLNQTLDQILNEPELSLATYIPLSLWSKLKAADTILTFLIFQNDFLFVNRTRMDKRPLRNILEISMQNYTGELPEDVPFIFNYQTFGYAPHQIPECGYWNYSTWITSGIRKAYKNVSNDRLLICHSSHLTHFAAIFRISFDSPLYLGESIMLNISHDSILDYISVLGCGMSFIGLSCIWLTAICFRSFRTESSNKVLLNISFVLSLLMVFFIFINLPTLWPSFVDIRNSLHCMIMGSFLHYIVLVLFFWMLIVAIMQYQRYVQVLGYERPSNYVAKYAILAWGLPLIPVALVAYLEPNQYMPNAKDVQNNNFICYPSGNGLKYGVILPLALIMLANLCIFLYISYSLRNCLKLSQHRHDRKNIIIQIRVSVLLFFLLGISWLFGLLSYLEGNLLFSYLFCLTSTLQGFVLFIYSIIIDKSTRAAWIVLCCAKSYKTMEDTHQVKYIHSRSGKSKRDH